MEGGVEKMVEGKFEFLKSLMLLMKRDKSEVKNVQKQLTLEIEVAKTYFKTKKAQMDEKQIIGTYFVQNLLSAQTYVKCRYFFKVVFMLKQLQRKK